MSGNPIALNDPTLEDIQFTLAGPTNDYGYTSFRQRRQHTGLCGRGWHPWNLRWKRQLHVQVPHAIPANATGTYVIGVESERVENILTGTNAAQQVESGTPNPVFYFLVDGSTVQPRRTVVGRNQLQSMPHPSDPARKSAQRPRVLRAVPQSVRYRFLSTSSRAGGPNHQQGRRGSPHPRWRQRCGQRRQTLHRRGPWREHERLLGCALPGHEPFRTSHLYTELHDVPRQRQRAESAGGPQGWINPVQAQSGPGSCVGLQRLSPCEAPRGALPCKHQLARREPQCMPCAGAQFAVDAVHAR
jgi:hypothetical protein